jgi:hypothetical protein
MLFSIAEIVNDLDFAQTFAIIRSQDGAFVKGVWVDQTVNINSYGVIQPATSKDIEMLPEGDRNSETFMFHSSSPMYETHSDTVQSGLSDLLVWRGNKYRIMKVTEFQDFGYWQALAVRKLAD